MYSFEQLVSEVEFLQEDKVLDYLSEFFVERNFASYLVNENANKKEEAVIKEMFTDTKDILIRAMNIFEKHPFCLEAFYVIYRLADETYVNAIMNRIYLRSKDYDLLNAYEKNSILNILNFYSHFLFDIHNITFSIKVLKTIIELEKKYSKENVARLSYLYCLLENAKDFYELYTNVGFKQVSSYLLLIVVLLKHEEELKAKEVFSELLDRFPYANYIDHIWDIESDNDEKAEEFKDAVDICFEEICAIPYFFSWCSDNKEKMLKA